MITREIFSIDSISSIQAKKSVGNMSLKLIIVYFSLANIAVHSVCVCVLDYVRCIDSTCFYTHVFLSVWLAGCPKSQCQITGQSCSCPGPLTLHFSSPTHPQMRWHVLPPCAMSHFPAAA